MKFCLKKNMYQIQSYVFEFHLFCFVMTNYLKMENFDILVETLITHYHF